MKILLVGSFLEGSLESSFYSAFVKLGYEIDKFIFLEEYKKVNPFAQYKYFNYLCSQYFYSLINQKLLKKIKLSQPELVLVIKGEFIFPETLCQIQQQTTALLYNFNPDNCFKMARGASNDLIRKSIPFYDCYFVWGQFLIPELKRAEAKRVEYLPFAYDPELHYPVQLTEQEKNIYGSDVAFIGTWDKEREKWLENLRDYDLAIWGNSWEKLRIGSPLRKKWRDRAVIGEEFSKVCNASKIVLNLVRKQNKDANNMRTFEVPACGGFMLATRTKEQCEFFTEGKEIECFDSIEELKVKINNYLCKDRERKAIAANAHDKASTHTYAQRAKKILNVYKELRANND